MVSSGSAMIRELENGVKGTVLQYWGQIPLFLFQAGYWEGQRELTCEAVRKALVDYGYGSLALVEEGRG